MSTKRTKQGNTAPAHLSAQMRKFYRDILDRFVLEDYHRLILQAACEAHDRCQKARRVLDRDSATYVDRFGSPHPRPETKVEIDSRAQFLRSLRELGLDLANSEVSRPPTVTGRRVGA